MKRIGLIVRSDDSGLGNQTRGLAEMINPFRVLVIDMSKYNGLTQGSFYYKDSEVMNSKGLPNNATMLQFLKGLDVVISCETFYNPRTISICRKWGIKSVLMYNWEFLDNLQNPNLLLPDLLIAPSKWHYDDVGALVKSYNKRYDRKSKLVHLPPPISSNDFERARSVNFKRTPNDRPKFLHVVGKKAVHDRNGTDTLLHAVSQSLSDFELVITSQLPLQITSNDDRVKFLAGNLVHPQELYTGYDAMIMPRKYGGLCLPMNESLMSGVPVIMSDISPNNQVLPKEWLVPAHVVGDFMARTSIDIFQTEIAKLSQKIDELVKVRPDKEKAYKMAVQFEADYLHYKYQELLEGL